MSYIGGRRAERRTADPCKRLGPPERECNCGVQPYLTGTLRVVRSLSRRTPSHPEGPATKCRLSRCWGTTRAAQPPALRPHHGYRQKTLSYRTERAHCPVCDKARRRIRAWLGSRQTPRNQARQSIDLLTDRPAAAAGTCHHQPGRGLTMTDSRHTMSLSAASSPWRIHAQVVEKPCLKTINRLETRPRRLRAERS
jgi:hypothetical protein